MHLLSSLIALAFAAAVNVAALPQDAFSSANSLASADGQKSVAKSDASSSVNGQAAAFSSASASSQTTNGGTISTSTASAYSSTNVVGYYHTSAVASSSAYTTINSPSCTQDAALKLLLDLLKQLQMIVTSQNSCTCQDIHQDPMYSQSFFQLLLLYSEILQIIQSRSWTSAFSSVTTQYTSVMTSAVTYAKQNNVDFSQTPPGVDRQLCKAYGLDLDKLVGSVVGTVTQTVDSVAKTVDNTVQTVGKTVDNILGNLL